MSYKVEFVLDLDDSYSSVLFDRKNWKDYTFRFKEVFGGKLTNISGHIPVGEYGHIKWVWNFKDESEAKWWMTYGDYYVDVYWKKKRIATEIRLREPQMGHWYSDAPNYDLRDGYQDANFKADKAKFDKLTSIKVALKLATTPATSAKQGNKAANSGKQQTASDATKTQKLSNGVTKSGPDWVKLYPNNNDLNILKEPFRTGAKQFINSMKNAGISVSIGVVYRPAERTYLMYYAKQIKDGMSPLNVPRSDTFTIRDTGQKIPYIPIDWAHMENGKPNEKAAKAAATAMVNAYKIGSNPAAPPGKSTHIGRQAIDMTITNFSGKSVKEAKGNPIKVSSFNDLVRIGATYGVIHFNVPNKSDPPHWSQTGR